MTSNITIRMDSERKQELEALFFDLGMSITTAVNVFFHQAIHCQGIPFAVKRPCTPNAETITELGGQSDVD